MMHRHSHHWSLISIDHQVASTIMNHHASIRIIYPPLVHHQSMLIIESDSRNSRTEAPEILKNPRRKWRRKSGAVAGDLEPEADCNDRCRPHHGCRGNPKTAWRSHFGEVFISDIPYIYIYIQYIYNDYTITIPYIPYITYITYICLPGGGRPKRRSVALVP